MSGAHSGGLARRRSPRRGPVRSARWRASAARSTARSPRSRPTGPTRCGSRTRSSRSASPSSMSLSAKNRKFRATRGITEDRCERRRDPLSRVSTAESSSIRASTPSAMRCRTWPDPSLACAPRSRAPGRRDGRAGLEASPRATSAMTCSSIGETSSKAPASEAFAANQWSVETSTPSTTAVRPLSPQRIRSYPNGMAPPLDVSIRSAATSRRSARKDLRAP